jgi:hypothetical protein
MAAASDPAGEAKRADSRSGDTRADQVVRVASTDGRRGAMSEPVELPLDGVEIRMETVLARENVRVRRSRGTPHGGPLSPLLANLYLDALDRELARRGLSFVGYADDIAVFVASERAAERVLGRLTRWLHKHLDLEVNAPKSGAHRTEETEA